MLARLEGAQVRPATDWAAEAAMGVRQFKPFWQTLTKSTDILLTARNSDGGQRFLPNTLRTGAGMKNQEEWCLDNAIEAIEMAIKMSDPDMRRECVSLAEE
jgi:hypothetical protein